MLTDGSVFQPVKNTVRRSVCHPRMSFFENVRTNVRVGSTDNSEVLFCIFETKISYLIDNLKAFWLRNIKAVIVSRACISHCGSRASSSIDTGVLPSKILKSSNKHQELSLNRSDKSQCENSISYL